LTRFLLITGVIASLAICYGCSAKPMSLRDTPLAANWGRSFETAKCNQIHSLDAEKNLDVVDGLDGIAGEKIMEKYQKSFEETLPRPVYNLTIGSVGGI